MTLTDHDLYELAQAAGVPITYKGEIYEPISGMDIQIKTGIKTK